MHITFVVFMVMKMKNLTALFGTTTLKTAIFRMNTNQNIIHSQPYTHNLCFLLPNRKFLTPKINAFFIFRSSHILMVGHDPLFGLATKFHIIIKSTDM
jgi:hypothetical protein